MKLVPLAETFCGTSTCPRVLGAPDGSIIVQGSIVSSGVIEDVIPEGEALVRIPSDLLIEAARSLQAGMVRG